VKSGRWGIDNQRHADAAAKNVADSIARQVGKLLPEIGGEQSLELVRFANKSASAHGLEAMLKLARSEPGIPVLPEQLDSHPWLFNCGNGIVDLKTGKLHPHDRELMLTKATPVEYLQGPEAECPLWEATLDKIFGGSDELVGFVRRLFGSAMAGDVVEHVLPIFWGNGSNGKSLITETILEVFGQYGGKAAPELLLAKRGEAHPTDKADLQGLRIVFAVETDQGRRLSESVAKELTGGDTVKARRMREDFWSFRPSHSVVLATNHRPRVHGTDHAIWRRLRLVPFTATFWDRGRGECGPPELEADKLLRNKLRAEHGGILRWLADGCREWQRDGLGEPAAVKLATGQYREAEDLLAAFINDCCIMGEECESKASDVRQRLDQWCKESGEKQVSGRRLGDYLAERGITKRRSNGLYYDGLALL
jgi:putative DNA primase/helicase